MGLELFQRAMLSGDSVLWLARGENPIAGFIAGAAEHNWDVPPGLAGRPTDEAYEWAKEAFLKTLRARARPMGNDRMRDCSVVFLFLQPTPTNKSPSTGSDPHASR